MGGDLHTIPLKVSFSLIQNFSLLKSFLKDHDSSSQSINSSPSFLDRHTLFVISKFLKSHNLRCLVISFVNVCVPVFQNTKTGGPLQSSDNYQTASCQGLLTFITWVQTESTGRGQARVAVVCPATLPQHVILGLTLRRCFINKYSSMHKWTALLYLHHQPVKSSCYQSTFYRWRNWDLER